MDTNAKINFADYFWESEGRSLSFSISCYCEVSMVLLEKIFVMFERGRIGLVYMGLILPHIFIR